MKGGALHQQLKIKLKLINKRSREIAIASPGHEAMQQFVDLLAIDTNLWPYICFCQPAFKFIDAGGFWLEGVRVTVKRFAARSWPGLARGSVTVKRFAAST